MQKKKAIMSYEAGFVLLMLWLVVLAVGAYFIFEKGGEWYALLATSVIVIGMYLGVGVMEVLTSKPKSWFEQ